MGSGNNKDRGRSLVPSFNLQTYHGNTKEEECRFISLRQLSSYGNIRDPVRLQGQFWGLHGDRGNSSMVPRVPSHHPIGWGTRVTKQCRSNLAGSVLSKSLGSSTPKRGKRQVLQRPL